MRTSVRAEASARAVLTVHLHGQEVGVLLRNNEGQAAFLPSEEWLARGQHPRLGLAFLRDPRPRVAPAGIPCWFDNLLPESGSPLRRRICQQRGIRETNTLALLRELGGDLPGAVEVRGRVVGDHAAEADPVPRGRLRFSLAGLQLKLSMVLGSGRFALPAQGETGQWIVKIPGDNLPELPEVEQATMEWGREIGFSVPSSQVVAVEALVGIEPEMVRSSRNVFAIERFDRLPDGRRVHQEDFAQALEIEAVHKYADTRGRRTSYDLLGRQVKDACGPVELGEFLDRMAFIIASGNGDAHLKNWSFQWDVGPRPRLSPLYDQVSTVAWPAIDGWALEGGPRLALALGRSRRFQDIDEERLATFCTRAGADGGVERVMHLLERARTAWKHIRERAPRIMVDGLTEHWRQVPILRRLGGLCP